LHGSERGDRLGHRSDAEQRVGRERAPGRDVRHAEGALIEHAPAIGNQRDHARHVLALDRTAQRGVDARTTGRILRMHRTGACRRQDSRADDHSDDVPIHESLPVHDFLFGGCTEATLSICVKV